MGYPILEINLEKLEENARAEVGYMRANGIEVIAVNKVFNGDAKTAAAVVRGGINTVAESRIHNLKKIEGVQCEKMLLRSPCLSEIADTVRYADISLNSELKVIEALSLEAVKQQKIHKIMLMIDMGDMREGLWFENTEEIDRVLRCVLALKNIEIYGLGTNFNCYGTVIPTVENGKAFVRLAEEMEKRLGIKFRFLSGGNCTSTYLVENGTMPAGINHLRIGGYHLFGQSYMTGRYAEIFHHSAKSPLQYLSDLYIYKAEIIEVNTKPTMPVGELGMDAFMMTKTFTDRGWRKRALLAFGQQDVSCHNICPVDENIEILGQTSDHTIIDIENCKDYKVGDIVSFEIDYTALLQLCNSDSLRKFYIQ